MLFRSRQAASSLRKNPVTFVHPEEAITLEGIGPKIVERLVSALKAHCESTGEEMPERSECAPWRRSCWIELSRADSADSRTRQEASSCKSVWSGAEEEARRSLSERRGRSRPPSRRTPPEDQDRNRIRPQQSTLTIPHSSRPLRRRRSSGSRPRESQKLQGVRPGAAQRRLRDPRCALYPLLLRRARQVVHSGRDHLRRRSEEHTSELQSQ